jgi:ADP-heptose:LPS heptosyltransferase
MTAPSATGGIERLGHADPPNLFAADPPERIAVFRALQLGDLLCAVPALRALRIACPRARITLIGLAWARDFVDRMPYLDDFVAFPGFPGLVETTPDIAQLPAFFAAMQRRRFDLAIQLHGSGGITNSLVAALGARRTAGFVSEGAWCPDPDLFMPWPQRGSEVQRLLALVTRLGARPCGEHLELPILAAERRAFNELCPTLAISGQAYVCMHPGARLATRRWLPERFAQVADALAGAGWTIVLTGTASEARVIHEVRARMSAPAIDLAGRTSLGTLATLVERARLVICNDTGISHIAAATRTPSIVVCCGADPERWRPLDVARHHMLWAPVPCRPCTHIHCPTDHECAHGITADRVLAVARALLAAPNEVNRAAA